MFWRPEKWIPKEGETTKHLDNRAHGKPRIRQRVETKLFGLDVYVCVCASLCVCECVLR